MKHEVTGSVPLQNPPYSHAQVELNPTDMDMPAVSGAGDLMSKAILYDATLCIGCKQCESACAQQNELPYDDKVAAESVQSEHKYTVVLNKQRQIHAQALPALRGASVRLGLPGWCPP